MTSEYVPTVEIDAVWKRYSDRQSASETPVLQGVSLPIGPGEIVSLLGPNACGKTTLLKIVAGILQPEEGSVRINGKPPDRASIGFVFQNFADSLLPWLTNRSNIVFPRHRELTASQSDQLRTNLLELQLGAIPLEKYPYQCSVGQQQLVALAREVLAEPDVLLLDEPFAALDLENRLAQQESLARICETRALTTLLVSHDLDEAIRLADRVIVLSARPAHILGEFRIDLPRPRSLDDLAGSHYLSLKAPILAAFQEATQR